MAQILVDPVVTEHVQDSIALASIGEQPIKGYDRDLEVFAVVRRYATTRHLGHPFVPGHARPAAAERDRTELQLAETDAD